MCNIFKVNTSAHPLLELSLVSLSSHSSTTSCNPDVLPFSTHHVHLKCRSKWHQASFIHSPLFTSLYQFTKYQVHVTIKYHSINQSRKTLSHIKLLPFLSLSAHMIHHPSTCTDFPNSFNKLHPSVTVFSLPMKLSIQCSSRDEAWWDCNGNYRTPGKTDLFNVINLLMLLMLLFNVICYYLQMQ